MPGAVSLELLDVSMRFGGVTAVNGMSFAVPARSITGLIGPNGAGKTTVFNCISGFYTPTQGKIRYRGNEITGRSPYQICAQGIARTFQNIRLFHTLTVLQNVMVGTHLRQKTAWWYPLIPGLADKEERYIRDVSMTLLERLHLAELADQPASALPYGAQRRLEIARALATKPTFLLLDEPAAGMNPQESIELMQLIQTVKDDFDLTILLIEHDMKVVMGVCSHIWVMEYGLLIAEGSPDQIRNDPKVIEAYLGEEYLRYA